MRCVALEGVAPNWGESPTRDAYQEACLENRDFTYKAGQSRRHERDVLAKYIDGVSDALAYRPWKPNASRTIQYAAEAPPE